MHGENKGKLEIVLQNKSNKALVFTHGFNGSYHPCKSFLKGLAAEPGLSDRTIYSFNYPSSMLRRDPDVSQIAKFLEEELAKLTESEIDLMGYSMGGLVMRKALVNLPDTTLSRIKHCAFIATPHLGAPMASWIPLPGILKKDQLKDLTRGSQFLKDLDTEWSEKFSSEAPFNMKAVAGTRDWLVPVKSALGHFPQAQQESIPNGHLSIVSKKNINALIQVLESLSVASSPCASLSQEGSKPEEKSTKASNAEQAGNKHAKRNKPRSCFGR